jgi:CRISPR-associated endonuclease/helicase Cas3
VRLVDLSESKSETQKVDNNGEDAAKGEEKQRILAIVSEVLTGFKVLSDAGLKYPAMAVVVNRVARAREVFEQLLSAPDLGNVKSVLMIGPARPVDRDVLANMLEPIRTESTERTLDGPLLIYPPSVLKQE